LAVRSKNGTSKHTDLYSRQNGEEGEEEEEQKGRRRRRRRSKRGGGGGAKGGRKRRNVPVTRSHVLKVVYVLVKCENMNFIKTQ